MRIYPLLAVLTICAAPAPACSGSGAGADAPAGPPAVTPPDATAPPDEGSPSEGSPGEPDEPGAHGDPKAALTAAVVFVGRFDTSDPLGPKAAWPGTRILTRFDGTAISVRLSETAEAWMDGAPSYWDVSIDDGPWRSLAMTADGRPRVFDLASQLPSGPHRVELYKRSETRTGITQFQGFNLHGGQFVTPPARQQRRIEVMGDAQSSGFGVEMLDAPALDCPGADHGGVYQSFRKAWGGRLGVMFDAEVHGLVYSGKGLIRNITPTDDDPLTSYYPRSNPSPVLAGHPPLFDLGSWVPDLIVMTQGSIDLTTGVDRGAFAKAYRDFVIGTLRARAANAHIVMGVLGQSGHDVIPEIAREIIAERAAVGDDKMHLFEPAPHTGDEMTGCNGHGTPAWHQRIADELAVEIRAALGWP